MILSNGDLKELYERKKKLEGSKEIVHFQDAHTETITSVALTFDNKYIVSGSWDRSIKLFDIERKQEVHQFEYAHESKQIRGSSLFLNN